MRCDNIKPMAGLWNIRMRKVVERSYYLSTVKHKMLTQYTSLDRVSERFVNGSCIATIQTCFEENPKMKK